MDKQIDIWTNRYMDKQIYEQIDVWINRYLDNQIRINRQIYGLIDRYMD